ncbi:MAG: CBS domain-containing protein [Candidatus Brocadia carolinensis]|uniref:CBS domain-containing protein n=1 Tax=Candidatus Brocadia carolinensis TaxID=1004156 RepID=A0A1V4AVD3_9BACT|nr:MAG: CBS domain-containing protein [Candidatus Brocadia caroliniensis]
MSVSSIMTHKVVTVEMDDTLLTIRMIFQHVKFHHLVVVDNRKPVGVISDRDFLKAVSPFLGKNIETTRDLDTLKKRAHQIMTRNPVTVYPETSIESAADLLLEKNISCLPVISSQGDIVGMVTWKDILQFYLGRK